MDELLTVKEVAAKLKVSRPTIYTFIGLGLNLLSSASEVCGLGRLKSNVLSKQWNKRQSDNLAVILL